MSTSGKYAGTAPATVAARDDTDPQFQVGGMFFDQTNFKTYRYVKFDNGSSNVAAANGGLAYWKTYPTDVYSDLSDAPGANATGDRQYVAGVFVNAITDAKYGFIQIGGRHTAVKTNGDDDIATGDTLIASTGDGTLDSVAAGTATTWNKVGWAYTADIDADDTVDTILTLEQG